MRAVIDGGRNGDARGGWISTCRTRRRARPPCGPRSTRPTFRSAGNGICTRYRRAPFPSSRRRVPAWCVFRGWASRPTMSMSSPAAAPVYTPHRPDRPRRDRQDREQGPAQPRGEPPPRGATRGRDWQERPPTCFGYGVRGNRAAGVVKGRGRLALSSRTARYAVEPPTARIRGSRTGAAAGPPSPRAGSAA